jgi:hypothetical protein
MATIAAASASYAHVSAAIALASAGDSVTVPAGTATWASQLVITAGINLIGNGIGSTVITSNYTPSSTYDPLISYDSQSPTTDSPVRLSGFTMDMNSRGVGICLSNGETTALSGNRIDHIAISNSPNRSIMIVGAIYGVIDNCDITSTVAFPISCFGANEVTWNNFTFAYGTANNMYVEDCTFAISDSAFEGGLGGRYCARYNTFTADSGLFPWFDAHGNMGPGGNHGTMGIEVYENTITAGANNINIADLRGGKCLVFNNSITTSGNVTLGFREEYLDSANLPATSSDGQPQHVSDAYVWGNKKNTVVRSVGSVTGTLDYGGVKGLVPQLNRDAWRQDDSFDGTIDVGMGLLAARPATCTTGVGYWATDTNILYRAVATNTWEAYYTPYTYPHPLRGEGVAPDVMTVTSPNGGESWAGNSEHNITWTNTGDTVYANVKIEYSANSGLTWTTVTASTANTGSYSWTVPNTAAAAYMIKVTAVV